MQRIKRTGFKNKQDRLSNHGRGKPGDKKHGKYDKRGKIIPRGVGPKLKTDKTGPTEHGRERGKPIKMNHREGHKMAAGMGREGRNWAVG